MGGQVARSGGDCQQAGGHGAVGQGVDRADLKQEGGHDAGERGGRYNTQPDAGRRQRDSVADDHRS